jgi:arylsulfatase
MEGALRVPFVIRWPGHIPAGRVSNEIVHVTDLFTTLARVSGAEIPADRVIDGVDQMDFFTGGREKSNREGFPVVVFDELYAVKWQNWKMHYLWRPSAELAPENVRKLFELRSDPKEEHDVFWQNDSVRAPTDKIVAEFRASLDKEPPIKPGTPDPYRPEKSRK